MAEIEIRPCPFCGGKRGILFAYRYDRQHGWCVVCDSCGARGPASKNSFGAMAVWNERKEGEKAW